MPSFALQRTKLIKVPLPKGHVLNDTAVYSHKAAVYCQTTQYTVGIPMLYRTAEEPFTSTTVDILSMLNIISV